MKLIDETIQNNNQSWVYTRIVKLDDGQKLRVRIVRNAYDFQSSAFCDRWDGSQWHTVNAMPIGNCACYKVSYIDKNPNKALFVQDAERLIAVAKQIVC